MKKVSTAAVKQSRNFSQPKQTIGLDLGDRNSWYRVLDEAGAIVLEQKLSTTGRQGRKCSARYRAAASLWKPGCTRPG